MTGTDLLSLLRREANLLEQAMATEDELMAWSDAVVLITMMVCATAVMLALILKGFGIEFRDPDEKGGPGGGSE